MSQTAKVLRSEPLTDEDSKWIGLKAIYWKDPTGKERKWESADRRTRKGDVDAIAICTIIHRPSSEPHLLLVSQFRPPVNQSVIEMPAGLVDEGEEGDEGAKRAALRELEEETGYGTDKEGGKVQVEMITNIMHNDPVSDYCERKKSSPFFKKIPWFNTGHVWSKYETLPGSH